MAVDIIHGSRAAAEAVKLCDVNVIAAYPITPQTHIVEDLAEMIANGELNAEYVKVESEHSAMSACIGSSATGARTFTATSSQGLALMHEMLFVASGMRLPIVMANANRALSAPLNIWNDQQDSISERDAGWIQLYAETNQEVLDTVIQAFRISEDKDVLLPSMVCLDGYVLTHTIEPVDVPDKSKVRRFLPPYKPSVYLDPKKPATMGAFAGPDTYTEFRFAQEKAMGNALEVVKKVDREYKKITGRGYGLIESYKTENADIILVTIGSLAGTIKEVVDAHSGKVGLVRIRALRPLPKAEILQALENARVVSVIEKDVSIGFGEGALFTEIKALLHGAGKNTRALGFIAGLGGRDVTPANIEEVIKKSSAGKNTGETTWVGLR